jgi:hypothetical protein
MTKKELIEKLSQYPDDAKIVIDTGCLPDEEDGAIWRSVVRGIHKIRFRPVYSGRLVWRPRKLEEKSEKCVILY